MARVEFFLEDKEPLTGKVLSTQVIVESGFDNKGQAEAWLAKGARLRYGRVFWYRCARIEVKESK